MEESNLIKHAKKEFEILGWPGNCSMQKLLCDGVLDLLKVFSEQGHSGSSAHYAIDLFKSLALFECIAPLTGEDDEWFEYSDSFFQNKRASNVFKDGKDGVAYDINGKIFRDPDGSCWTNGDSRVNIEFPYIPKSEYIDRDFDNTLDQHTQLPL